MGRILNITLLLIFGLLAYWFFRPEIIFFNVLQLHNAGSQISGNSWILFFRNHFADMVWCLAIFQAVAFLTDRKYPAFYSYLLLSLPFLSEIFQGTGLIRGTFDWIDVLIYFLLLLLFITKKFMYAKSKKTFYRNFSCSFFYGCLNSKRNYKNGL